MNKNNNDLNSRFLEVILYKIYTIFLSKFYRKTISRGPLSEPHGPPGVRGPQFGKRWARRSIKELVKTKTQNRLTVDLYSIAGHACPGHQKPADGTRSQVLLPRLLEADDGSGPGIKRCKVRWILNHYRADIAAFTFLEHSIIIGPGLCLLVTLWVVFMGCV